jgi:hypothetical protein
LYNSACALAGLGREKEALARLREAIDAGFSDLDMLAAPALETLRGRPEFDELVAEARRSEVSQQEG